MSVKLCSRCLLKATRINVYRAHIMKDKRDVWHLVVQGLEPCKVATK
jgi:hypothetical protein